uniref:hypothetical protein n=1 Tax=Marinobacterium profundum TaxID=1714300 RepID=UPI00082B9EFA|nr:hypothetical protein [Marinobacterium profundum]
MSASTGSIQGSSLQAIKDQIAPVRIPKPEHSILHKTSSAVFEFMRASGKGRCPKDHQLQPEKIFLAGLWRTDPAQCY